MHILVIDDNEFERHRLLHDLEALGCATLEAGSGQEGVRVFHHHHPDLALVDIGMPGMDGLETFHALRAGDSNARVVLMGALGQEVQALQALLAGAQDFFVKPVSRQRLHGLLAQADLANNQVPQSRKYKKS